MKELSVEEKAKAYDEAIEKLRDFYRDYDTVSCLIDVKEELANLFPALKESEDEKIRKEIISYLKTRKGYTEAIKDLWIVWLEKQGNSPIKWNKNTEGNKPQVNHTVLMKTTEGIAEGEWIGEYWLQYRWAGIIRDSDVLSWIEFSDLEKQGEQESAWSKEDEEHYKACLQYFDAVNPDMVYYKDYQWLISLKQRYTWKPSDGQLKALKHASNDCSIAFADMKVLATLYKQLKALYRYEQDT